MTGPWIAIVVALWALVVVLGLIVLGTLRRLAPILERAEASVSTETASMTGLPVGSPVPSFAAEDVRGRAFTEADLAGSQALVLFLGSSCQACERFVRDLEHGMAPELEATLIVVSADQDAAQALARSPEATVVVDAKSSAARAFDSNLVPQAFVVERGKVAASGRPNDWNGLRNLLEEAKGGESTLDVPAAAVR